MSTNRSVGRVASTQDKVRSTSTHNTARSAVTHEHGRPARKSKKDRSSGLCTFAFADGRQCRTPRCSSHPHFCYFHAQKEAESLAAQQVGQDISRFLPNKLLTACDLGVAMSRLFCAVAQGQIKPKVASTLAYLAQTMLQSIPLAQHEYIETFNPNVWHNAVRASFRFDDLPSTPVYPEPRREPGSPSSSAPPTPPQPSVNYHSDAVAQAFRPEEHAFSSFSAPSPHTPLPRTGAEFFHQVISGRNSSRSETPTPPGTEIPTLSEPARDPSSSASSSPATPQPPANCHSASSGERPTSGASPDSCREEPASSPNSPLACPPWRATHHSFTPSEAEGPLPQPTPPPLPPTSGAPANWEVLIPPKPRRKFPRRW